MLSSMTGFGRCCKNIGGYEVTVEIKSVNHRYFEFNARVPRTYSYLENMLKTLVSQRVLRGKTEVFLSLRVLEGADSKITLNRNLAKGYADSLSSLAEELGLENDLKLSTLTRFGDIFEIEQETTDETAMWEIVKPAAEQALDSLLEMRRSEGERLQADITAKLGLIRSLTGEIERLGEQTVQEYRERLRAKLEEVLETYKYDEGRILTEAAIFAEKITVDEERVRLLSHLSQFESLIKSTGSVGKKLDFIVQEIHREINTIGSKSHNIDLGRLVIEAKSILENIREQIQNIQ